MTIDLHIHSTASDGAYAPRDIVRRARDAGVLRIALTDHDSVAGVPDALAAGSELGVTVIPGVELSAETDDGRAAHILGYFIESTDPILLAHLESLRATRLDRATRMVAALSASGIPITLEDVLARAREGAVGRAHVALALVDAGVVPSMSAAFSTLIGRDGPYFVAKPVPGPGAVIETIHAAGGVAVLAHPAISGIEDLIPAFAEAGLDGVEAYHSQHDVPARSRLVHISTQLGLVVTGGSDFHGLSGSHGALGDGGTPDSAFDALVARAAERHASSET
ncbi:MAG: PHP domain-containing protein [Coriobacteriia bacterium]